MYVYIYIYDILYIYDVVLYCILHIYIWKVQTVDKLASVMKLI